MSQMICRKEKNVVEYKNDSVQLTLFFKIILISFGTKKRI